MKTRLAQKHFERGRDFELQDREADALEAYRQACELSPDFADPYYALGRLEASRGRCETALTHLERAAALSDDPEIVEWRAYAFGRLRRYGEALADYLSILDQGDPVVRVNAGRMLLALGRYDEAERLLVESDEPSARPLLDALPRYQEYTGGETPDDMRATRYLFGGTLVIGTLGDGGVPLVNTRYALLTDRHVSVTIGRLLRLVRECRWSFDAVAGRGPHHGPVALALADLLDLPLTARPEHDARVLLVSAVVEGATEARGLVTPWRKAGARVLHFALGLVPDGDPSPEEPEIVGFVNRCAAYWYRVAPYARLEPAEDTGDAEWPGFRVGPAFVDPNSERVAADLVEACRKYRHDPLASAVLDYYLRRHPQVRALGWNPK